jgi:hypothetical protein
MRHAAILFIVLGIFCLSCSKEDADSSVPRLEIDFTWPNAEECFDKRSPEIRIKEVPEGTRAFAVSLYDVSNRREHGGGTVNFEGKGLIAEGSVKGNYEGPCPPGRGASPDYEMTVKAIDEWGKVLGIGKMVKTYLDRD